VLVAGEDAGFGVGVGAGGEDAGAGAVDLGRGYAELGVVFLGEAEGLIQRQAVRARERQGQGRQQAKNNDGTEGHEGTLCNPLAVVETGVSVEKRVDW
jgi:hypothetical protein